MSVLAVEYPMVRTTWDQSSTACCIVSSTKWLSACSGRCKVWSLERSCDPVDLQVKQRACPGACQIIAAVLQWQTIHGWCDFPLRFCRKDWDQARSSPNALLDDATWIPLNGHRERVDRFSQAAHLTPPFQPCTSTPDVSTTTSKLRLTLIFIGASSVLPLYSVVEPLFSRWILHQWCFPCPIPSFNSPGSHSWFRISICYLIYIYIYNYI